ncbi:hypothetical protein LVD13_13115 [Flavobacteriaceae bacterium D16]|nr:hypothetical protein [Flavobacteriaceae bacterium D16]
MNKTPLLLIFLFFLGYTVSGQLNSIETDEQIVRRLIMRGADLPPGMTDSPYDNEEFQLGKTIIRDSIVKNAMLRYDAYRDNIEIQEKGGSFALFKRDYIRASINGELFGIFKYLSVKGELNQGYFVQLTEGPVMLLKKKSKTFHYGTQGDGYTAAKPPRFTDLTEYYLKSGDSPAEPVKLRKKTILKALGDTKEASKIVKENNLNLSRERDVVLLINGLKNL